MNAVWSHGRIANLCYVDHADCTDIASLPMSLYISSETERQGIYTLQVWLGDYLAESQNQECENVFEARVNTLWMATEFFHRTHASIMDAYYGEKLAFFGDL